MTAPLQLLLYFFLYAFLGWCAEVAFAAVTTRQLVNRGFLNGPQCPIYGFGMVALLVTLGPWRQNLPAVFFGSMVLATLVELVGGWLLYRLFHTGQHHWIAERTHPFTHGSGRFRVRVTAGCQYTAKQLGHFQLAR